MGCLQNISCTRYSSLLSFTTSWRYEDAKQCSHIDSVNAEPYFKQRRAKCQCQAFFFTHTTNLGQQSIFFSNSFFFHSVFLIQGSVPNTHTLEKCQSNLAEFDFLLHTSPTLWIQLPAFGTVLTRMSKRRLYRVTNCCSRNRQEGRVDCTEIVTVQFIVVSEAWPCEYNIVSISQSQPSVGRSGFNTRHARRVKGNLRPWTV